MSTPSLQRAAAVEAIAVDHAVVGVAVTPQAVPVGSHGQQILSFAEDPGLIQ